MLLFDRLASFVTGLGTSKDKSTTAGHVHVARSADELRAAYRDNWIARKAIDIVPFDMLREWRSWQADAEVVGKIEAAETALDLSRKLNAAMVRGRLFGGGAILIGDGAPDPAQELVIDRIPLGGIRYLHVLSRHEITTGEIQRDPTSPFYGEPAYYEVSGAQRQQRIHPSRVVRFLGAPLPDDMSMQADAWSDSILQAILDSVDQASSAAQHIAAMLPEAKQDIISVPGLSEHLSTEESTKKLTARFVYAQRMKSMFGMLVLEGDGTSPEGETYQQKQLSFASLPDVARLFLQMASGAADIPVTRMLGQAPAGLNATGDSDTRNFYDHIAAKQKVELGPTIRRLDRILLRHALGEEPAGVWYSWNPLYQLSEKEKAEIGKIKADTAQVLANAALVPDEVLAEGVKGWLTSSDILPGIEDAYDAHSGPLTGTDPSADGLGPDGLPADPERPGNVVPFRKQATTDAAPRTLYVSRKLRNGADLIAWAKSQGFETLMPAGELHVTIAYSKAPLDWMKVAPTWQGEELKIDAGGPRLMEQFGDAVVLLFASSDLQWRHREIGEAGASFDHPEYQPHVTITWDRGDIDLSAVQAYNGPLVFGPEIFAEVDEDWRTRVGEVRDARPFDGADEDEIAAVTYDDLLELFSAEALESAGITHLTEDARRHGKGGGGRFNEGDHPRDANGRFAGKGGSGSGGRLTKGAKALKDSGVGMDDGIEVLSSRVRKYRGHETVASFVDSHPRGKAHALRTLAADHKAGRIGFTGKSSASSKYDERNFSDFSKTDSATVREVERDLYRSMVGRPETPQEIAAINNYSGASFSEINGFLRSRPSRGNKTKIYDEEDLGSEIRHLDNVMKRSRMTEDTLVYRGVTGDYARTLRSSKAGRVIKDKGFVSTSLHRSVASGSFAGDDGVVLRLMLPKGNPAYLMNGRGASNFATEHEVLLPRNSRFRVRSVEGNVVTAEVL